MRITWRIQCPALLFFSISLLAVACQQVDQPTQEVSPGISQAEESSVSNTLSQQEQSEGWELLFDGETTDGWRKAYESGFPSGGWVIEEGALVVLASNVRQGGSESGGSIVTEQQYSDFELRLDFMLTEGANSGIKYFVVEDPGFFGDDPAGRGIGLEYQVLDDENHPDAQMGVNGNRTVGSLYDMIPAAQDKTVQPLGEWNRVRLLSVDGHVEHWLNGQKVLEYERGSDAYRALVDNSKYNVYENFGMASQGHILLQDHGDRVEYRNIKIRTLD